MHKRPSLQEALELLNRYSHISHDCCEALRDYQQLKQHSPFLAARMVVDIVDHYNHITESRAYG